MNKLLKTDAHWKEVLSDEEFRICRKKGTEPAFTGKYWQVDGKPGVYLCRCCSATLFDAAEKFDSGSGWPSFTQPVETTQISELSDVTLGMRRTEVLCSNCDAHLGHVFPDGPAPSGLRYCINSTSLEFAQESEKE